MSTSGSTGEPGPVRTAFHERGFKSPLAHTSRSRAAHSPSLHTVWMGVDAELVDAAVALVRERFGAVEWAGAAAVRLEDGSILTSTAPDIVNEAVSLCHETGALCEAYKLGKNVVASVCVVQPTVGQTLVLAPCGVCQERLFVYGPAVEVGVATADGGWRSARLDEVQPHHWRKVLPT